MSDVKLEKPKIQPWRVSTDGNLTPPQKALLKTSSMMICMPAYGGQMSANCAKSIVEFYTELALVGAKPSFFPLGNESLIQRGRNTMAAMFLKTKFEYLMFIDSDIGFVPSQLCEMYLAALKGQHKLVGATYPKKFLNHNGIAAAVRSGKMPDDKIGHCGGDHAVRFNKTGETLQYYDLNPVKYLPTGFLLIHRSVFEALEAKTTPFMVNTIPGEKDLVARTWFDCPVEPNADGSPGELLSEDWYFCKIANEVGITPLYAPWVELRHYGTYGFHGCMFCSNGQYIHFQT